MSASKLDRTVARTGLLGRMRVTPALGRVVRGLSARPLSSLVPSLSSVALAADRIPYRLSTAGVFAGRVGALGFAEGTVFAAAAAWWRSACSASPPRPRRCVPAGEFRDLGRCATIRSLMSNRGPSEGH